MDERIPPLLAAGAAAGAAGFVLGGRRARSRRDKDTYRLAAIVSSADDAILSKTLDGIVTSWNPGAERLYGYTEQEMVGRHVTTLLPENHEDEVPRILATVARGDRVDHFETVRRRKDGTFVDVSLTVSPVRDRSGRIIGASTIARDITERKRLEEEIEHHRRELERSNQELEQFAYVASHDLQEPLRMVASYVQLLERRYGDQLDEDARQFIAFAVDGANRMSDLIRGLLAYSRAGVQAEWGPVDADQALDVALANLKGAIVDEDAVIERDPLPTVKGDELQLSLVFQNLIGNALKFRGQERPTIRVGAEPDGDWWKLSVADNGIGMDAGSAHRAFTIFQRLHGRDQYPGAGIGLSICKKIVERHGGDISVRAEEGKGATFWFTMPAWDGEA